MTVPSGPIRLLHHATCYAAESVDGVVPGTGSRPTPCEDWDLQALLMHLNRSIGELHRSITLGYPDRSSVDRDGHASAAQLAATFRSRARLLLGSCAGGERADPGIRTANAWVTVVGAAEIAVHGWDVSVACGSARAIPDRLALALLCLLHLRIDDAMRQPLFGPAIPVSPLAGPSDQLVAFLGRRPVSTNGPHRGEFS